MATTNIQSFAGDVEVNSNLTVNTNTLHADSVSGRVGVGKTDPAYAMDVNGTVNATAFYVNGSAFVSEVWTSNVSNIYYTTGAVGIGTTDPQKTLEVAGPMRITDGGTNVSDFSVDYGLFQYQSKIRAPDVATNDFFGHSVSVSSDGSYAIAGAYKDDGPAGTPEPDYGSAYIYVRSGSTWTLQQKITAPNGAANDCFGVSVSISSDGSYAIAGTNGDDSNQGSAHIFSRSGTSWTHQQNITAPDATGGDNFGYSVSISSDGSYAIAGAYGEDDGGAEAGAAYMYIRSGTSWTFQQKITAPDAGGGDEFGAAVSISGDGSYAISGAWKEDARGSESGSAYIFVRSGTSWTHQQKITGSGPSTAPQDFFGKAVSISSDGSYTLVGAYGDSVNGTYRGSAHIFSRSGTSWTHQQKITAPDATPIAFFGKAVSISGDGSRAIAGATLVSKAYVFSRSGSTWSYLQDITAPDGERDSFGVSVSISADGIYTYVGADADDGPAGRPDPDYGSTYVHKSAETLYVSTPITADGTLLSFTGQHICFPEGPMGQGLIVSANKNKYVSLNGSLTTGNLAIKSSEALPVVSLSNVASDPSVFGVVDHFEQSGTTRSQKSGATVITQDKESGDNRVVVNSLGEGAIWVANTNGNVVSGDFLTTSHLPGYAQRQSEAFRCNYTVAKSTMDCDFEPEELPVQVILKDDDGNNVLDSYGRLQWVDSDRTEPGYIIRYLDVSGTPTDEANAVHKAAYVGCTYHCG